MSISPESRTGVLLVNLGTPDSSSTADVRKYLIEFLSDPRVLDISSVSRYLLVNGLIAPFRSPRSAASYREIWFKEGSPLLVYGLQVEKALQESLGEQYLVKLAMRYQSPSIESSLEEMRTSGIDHMVIIPMFPQYASASTGSVQEKVMDILGKWPVVPEVTLLKSYHNDPGLINGFVENGRKQGIENFDHVLFSFHGLPVRQLKKADPAKDFCQANTVCCGSLNEINKNCYSAQCYDTARLIAGKLGLAASDYTVCFQSRLGRTPWVPPYTIDVLPKLAEAGKKKLLVFCPAFVADCLETLYEVSVEYNEDFKKMGGESVTLVESLNASPTWIKTLAGMVHRSVPAGALADLSI